MDKRNTSNSMDNNIQEHLEKADDNECSRDGQTEPLISQSIQELAAPAAADPRRFYILFVFSLLTFTQGGVWNTWGSISASAECAFGWEDSTIALLSNWGPITYIISTLFFAWLADVKGLRVAVLLTALLVALGCGLRCITFTPPASSWLIHTGQLLNGLGGPVAMGGPPLVSATWFPVHERTKSTAVGCITNGLGVAVSFIIAPLLVPDVPTFHNATHNVSVNCSESVKNEIIHGIRKLMYIEGGWSAAIFVIFVMAVVYFPAKPPQAPSISASIQRLEFRPALAALLKNRYFWMLSLPYAISCGVFGVWSSILDVNLKARNVTQSTAAWVAFWSTIAAQFLGLAVGIFADIFARRMKIMIIILYIVASAAFLVFTLMYVGLFNFSIVALYITNIVGTAALGGAPPLLYELVCEVTFPVAEGITNLFMTAINNVAGLVFLTIPMIVSGTTWMNWFMVAAIVICLPVFILFPERYTRFDIDTEKEETHN